MYLGQLDKEITKLRGIGPATSARLSKLGISAVRDLLLHLPRRYEDRTTIVPLSQAPSTDKACVIATVFAQTEMGKFHKKTIKASVSDGISEAVLVCFGRPFLRTVLVPGKKFYIWGSFRKRFGEIQCADFELEPWSEKPAAFGRILPEYPLSEGLNQGVMRRVVREALREYASLVEDELPAGLVRAHNLPHKAEALAGVHFPGTMEQADRCLQALAYEELFWFELLVMRRRRARTAARSSARKITDGLRRRLVERLPFELTGDQKKAAAEIEADLSRAAPMARLLQGDVGCGKTLVALASALLVVEAGEQVAFAAPTELLARQHAENAAALLEPIGVRAAFLSGSVAQEQRRLLTSALAAGEIDILFGTHALFSEDVAFRDLGLVIVDEQHKFGVLQRTALLSKGRKPDLLLMTATPIPRTLALTAFGDLDISTIEHMPLGRKKTVTHLAREGNEEKVYKRVREEIEKGRQAYFVYPLIDESESLSLKDAESSFRQLKEEVYPDLNLALIHSRVAEEEKERAMSGFVRGRVHILVATSVVEVGVDVANATCMVVEHAERFGLSTLHQLRGRVGRSVHQSYAFLVYGQNLTEEGIQRLKIMMETTDGFRIAEQDLKLRGPGELLGIRQSGFLGFKIADLVAHYSLVAEARSDAARVLAEDPGFLQPENAVLSRVLAACPPFSGIFTGGG